MSYKVKSTIVSIAAGVLLMAAYVIYAAGQVQSGAATLNDLRFWARTILIFIGIGIAAMIVIQIVFHILLAIGKAIREQVKNGKVDDKEIEKSLELDMVEDEMDKLISLKSMRIGYALGGFGFVLALVSLVMDQPAAVMLNVLFASFYLGSLIEALAQLFYYRRGIRNS
ncbi:MAG: hypothetical protein AB9880_10370 [Christensenellales bacterium]